MPLSLGFLNCKLWIINLFYPTGSLCRLNMEKNEFKCSCLVAMSHDPQANSSPRGDSTSSSALSSADQGS